MNIPKSQSSAHTLFCLPHAGGSAYVFYALKPRLPASVRIVPLDYPGHGARAAEPLLYSVEAIAHNLLDSPHFNPNGAFSLLGHSMGALIAWLITRILCRRGQPPVHLFLSARQPPCIPRSHPDLNGCSDPDFIRGMALYGGLPREITSDASALAFFLPILRADFTAVERWKPSDPPSPLPVPITAFYGRQDGSIPPGSMETWSKYTLSGFRHAGFEGGHFYLYEDPEPVSAHIAQALDGAQK